MYLFKLYFSLDVCLGVGLLSHMATLFSGFGFFFFFFSFLRNFHIGCSNLLFYQESAGEFPFLHTSSAAAAKSLQSYPTLWDPIDGSPPSSAVPGILQARTLEWVAISSSNAWKWKVKVKSLSHIRLLATSWTAAYQAPLSMGFSREEYWSGVPLPSLTPPLSICLWTF